MKVIIMRGIPGSGKSHYADSLVGPRRYVSADHYHMIGGEYRYDPTKAGEAHKACLKDYIGIVANPNPPEDLMVIVDNTNTQLWEVAPYYQLADALGIQVKIVTMVCEIKTAIQRGIHQVPNQRVFEMHRRMMETLLPAHWVHEVICSY